MKKLNNRGFTIIELVIVIVIMGILISIAVPNYMHSMEIANCSQGMGTLKNMRTAALDYFRENQTFSGIDIATLETQVGANFADTTAWTFAIAGGAATVTITATRTLGPHAAGTIQVNELEVWSGSYPFNDPEVF